MTECLTADALLAIGDALDWNVADGLRHLDTCDECRAQLETMQLARASLTASEPVDDAVLRRISTAIDRAAAAERVDSNRHARWAFAIEVFVAGIAALVVLTSSGVHIQSFGAAVGGFTLGGALLIAGRVLARRVPALRLEATHA